MFRPTTRPLLLALLVGACAPHPPVGQPGHHHRGPDGAATGRLFISPMGEPFRSELAGDPEAAWFAGADSDHDGRVSLAEFQADAARWFAVIDRGHDGEIDPDDIDYYENQLVPEVRVADARSSGSGAARQGGRGGAPGGGRGGGMRGGNMGGGGMGGGHRGGQQGQGGGQTTPSAPAVRQGAARYSYLDLPEPLTAADANLNRGVDAGEMTRAAASRFAELDKNGDGYLDRRELPRVDTRSRGFVRRTGAPRPDAPPADRNRQLGGGDREQD